MHCVLRVTIGFSEFYPGTLGDEKLFPVFGVIVLCCVGLSKLFYKALISLIQDGLGFIQFDGNTLFYIWCGKCLCAVNPRCFFCINANRDEDCEKKQSTLSHAYP